MPPPGSLAISHPQIKWALDQDRPLSTATLHTIYGWVLDQDRPLSAATLHTIYRWALGQDRPLSSSIRITISQIRTKKKNQVSNEQIFRPRISQSQVRKS